MTDKDVEKVMKKFENRDEHPSEWLREALTRMKQLCEEKNNYYGKRLSGKRLDHKNYIDIIHERDRQIASLQAELEKAEAEDRKEVLEEAKNTMFSYLTPYQFEKFCNRLEKLKQKKEAGND